MKILFALGWMLLVSVCLSLLLLPACVVLALLQPDSVLSGIGLALMIPPALLAGFFLLLGLTWIYCRALPPTPQGKFNLFEDRGAVLWALNNALPTLLLKLFQSTLFLSEHLRYCLLRACNADMRFSSWIPTNASIADLRNLHLGENVVIGEHCTLGPAFQPRPYRLVVSDIHIGDNSLVGAHSMVAAGVHIGANVLIQAQVMIASGSRLGNNVKIGVGTRIDTYCHIGEGAVVGKWVTLLSRAHIPEGAQVPDGAMVRGKWIDPKQEAETTNE